jgi:ClpP class serine protease
LFSILWMIIIVSSLLSPLLGRRKTELARVRLLNSLSRKRGSRVISMIHRMEAINFLGIPISRHIDIEDSEQILRAIRRTPKDVPIDIILHTPGGLVLAAEQIARAVAGHEAKGDGKGNGAFNNRFPHPASLLRSSDSRCHEPSGSYFGNALASA